MKLRIFENKKLLGEAAATDAAHSIREAIALRDAARIIVATGASQFEFLRALVQLRGIDWSRVEMFHLDEYVGLPDSHPASFRKYLRERFIEPTGITNHHFLNGEQDAAASAREVGDLIGREPIDVAFVGIGENGHLAFNDPPADFDVDDPYIIVNLDEPCRRQQVGEGWFKSVDEVPKQAISMSIRQILKSREILCIVPDARKAPAVKKCLEGEISPDAPASILRRHPNTTVYLDNDSASQLSRQTIETSHSR